MPAQTSTPASAVHLGDGTLRTYLDSGRNRRRTAALLHVHANTVDYRLRQVGRLTGLDPA